MEKFNQGDICIYIGRNKYWKGKKFKFIEISRRDTNDAYWEVLENLQYPNRYIGDSVNLEIIKFKLFKSNSRKSHLPGWW